MKNINIKAEGLTTAAVWIALAVSLTVWGWRIASAVSIERPFLGWTSGCEEEALFSVWKATRGYTVYNNPWLPPFSGSYFGWLFYAMYGCWSALWMQITGLEDAWLPTFTRFLTLIGLLFCISTFYKLGRGIGNQIGFPRTLCMIGFSSLVFINPLFHWWSFTTRPDVWALALELGALLAALFFTSNGRPSCVVIAGALAFLAWSFRQTNVSVLIGFGLWLLISAQWRVLLPLMAGMALAFTTTALLLGSTFIDSAFVANALSGAMVPAHAWMNALGALTKNPLLAVGLAGLLVLVFFIPRWWRNPEARLCFLVGAISTANGLVLSAKIGASSNYYLPAAAFVPLFVLRAIGQAGLAPFWQRGFLVSGALGVAIASALVLMGVAGKLRVAGDASMHELRSLRSTMKQPVFCNDRVANLPWILGAGADSYVFGYAYGGMLAAKPENFVKGSIADQLRQGQFKTVVISRINSHYEASSNELAGFTASGGRVIQFP
jgi:hypothetical protein